MSLVVLSGDCVTTTALALAAVWPTGVVAEPSAEVDPTERIDPLDPPVFVMEADHRGGSLAAWLDLPVAPSLSTTVTTVGVAGWAAVSRTVRSSDAGVHVLTAPVRSLEASRAVFEAERSVLPVLAARDHPTVLVDAGDPVPSHRAAFGLARADVAVVVHRQIPASARAAAVRVERLAEQVEVAAGAGLDAVLAVIGRDPWSPAEIGAFVLADQRSPVVFELAHDPLAAAVLAGRSGVSGRRFARLPLMRSARTMASWLAAAIADRRSIGTEVPAP